MPVFLRRVRIKNYKSIAACDVPLGQLMFLVGANGAGKSNFLDALRFVADALRTSLDHALRDRSGISEVRRRSGGHPTHFSLRLDFTLQNGRKGHYAFTVGARQPAGFEVQEEECYLYPSDFIREEPFYRVKNGAMVETNVAPMPAIVPDRLLLVAASGTPQFRPVFDALSRLEIYNLNPKLIAEMQKPDPGDLLRRDGGNAASILHNMPDEIRTQISETLALIVPGIASAESKTLGQLETIEFRQNVKNQKNPWRFEAASMSDGTLRAFGVLLAAFQAASTKPGALTPLLIGLEEPEMALHPAAASILLSALRRGARNCQILVTSHSPELLDDDGIKPEELLVVDNIQGITRIGPVDSANRETLRNKLCTPGELLRLNQLASDPAATFDDNSRQPSFFGKLEG